MKKDENPSMYPMAPSTLGENQEDSEQETRDLDRDLDDFLPVIVSDEEYERLTGEGSEDLETKASDSAVNPHNHDLDPKARDYIEDWVQRGGSDDEITSALGNWEQVGCYIHQLNNEDGRNRLEERDSKLEEKEASRIRGLYDQVRDDPTYEAWKEGLYTDSEAAKALGNRETPLTTKDMKKVKEMLGIEAEWKKKRKKVIDERKAETTSSNHNLEDRVSQDGGNGDEAVEDRPYSPPETGDEGEGTPRAYSNKETTETRDTQDPTDVSYEIIEGERKQDGKKFEKSEKDPLLERLLRLPYRYGRTAKKVGLGAAATVAIATGIGIWSWIGGNDEKESSQASIFGSGSEIARPAEDSDVLYSGPINLYADLNNDGKPDDRNQRQRFNATYRETPEGNILILKGNKENYAFVDSADRVNMGEGGYSSVKVEQITMSDREGSRTYTVDDMADEDVRSAFGKAGRIYRTFMNFAHKNKQKKSLGSLLSSS